jgi:hypothetical protein
MAGVEGLEPPTLGLEILQTLMIPLKIKGFTRQIQENSGKIRNPGATRVRGSLPLETRRVVVIETYSSRRDLAEEYLKISLFKPYLSLAIT